MLIVYGVSAIRVLGILPYFFPHLRVLGDMMGDVLFHLQPEDSPLFAKKETIPRLRGLLQALRSGDEKLVLIGYSQGSVICWEVLRENPDLADKYITDRQPSQRSGGWSNFYRNGDYIGGEVEGCSDNRSLGDGDHLNDWSDERFMTKLKVVI